MAFVPSWAPRPGLIRAKALRCPSIHMSRPLHETSCTRRAALIGGTAAVAAFANLVGPAIAADPTVSIEEITVGTGASPSPGATIKVHYTLTLGGFEGDDGAKVVDSSRSRRKPFRYQYMGGQVIKGWEAGVEGMKVGSRRRIVVPSELGYGARGAGGGLIPPNATLYFDIELLGINS